MASTITSNTSRDRSASERTAPERLRLTSSRTITLAASTLVVLTLALFASVALGARVVSLDDVVSALGGSEDNLSQIAVRQRLPRTVLAVLVGAANAIGGAALQGVTRNPLADPGILGISSGASLAVVIGIAFFGLSSPLGYLWVAIAGSAGAALFVWVLGSTGFGGPTPIKLALAGAATWAAFSSLISAILLPRVDVMDQFRFWQIGGVGGAEWDRIALVSPFFAAGALVCLGSARGINALALGDDVAAGLGARVARTRLVASLGAVTLVGAATAVAGPIAFVGLVVPHLMRAVVGVDHRHLLPFCALGGAVLLVCSDVVGRVVTRPSELDVGIVTAFVGAPVFIGVIRSDRVRLR
ncbi:MAG: iron ABC transporter permease [Acidimicrobiales bacterium]